MGTLLALSTRLERPRADAVVQVAEQVHKAHAPVVVHVEILRVGVKVAFAWSVSGPTLAAWVCPLGRMDARECMPTPPLRRSPPNMSRALQRYCAHPARAVTEHSKLLCVV